MKNKFILMFFIFNSLNLSAQELPEIPKNNLQTSDALRIREELELIKKGGRRKKTS